MAEYCYSADCGAVPETPKSKKRHVDSSAWKKCIELRDTEKQ